MEDIIQDHPDLAELAHGPTRDDRKIDRTFTNFNRSIVESYTLPPLETEVGNVSDHRMVFGKGVFAAPPNNTVTYKHRPFTEQGAAAFLVEIEWQQWEGVLTALGVEEKVEAFQGILAGYMDKFFPIKSTTKRSTDPPWVNEQIRKLSRKRRRIYDREGRSKRWKRLKKKSDNLYRTRAGKYLEKQRELLTGPDAARTFYKHVRDYSSREKPPAFDPCDLYPTKTKEEVAKNLAEHFNGISKEFTGIEPGQIPSAPSSPIPVLTTEDVRQKLIKIKKPRSMVPGDIFRQLVDRGAAYLACPLASIYNAISADHVWPSQWKIEHVTPIPKKNMPETPNDLRNISCTQLF